MIKHALMYGAAAAIAIALWSMIEYWLGFHTTNAEVGRYSGFVGMIFPILAIIGAIRAERQARGGQIGFGHAFGQGMAVSAVIALLSAGFIGFYFSAINPAFLTSQANQGAPATIGGQMMLVAGMSLAFGAVISLIAAAVLRKAKRAATVA